MPRSYLPAVHAALTLAMRHPPADPARHFSCLPSTLHFKMQSHADQARLLHRTTIALSQLHRLLQQATDVLANLHSLYLVHTRQVDPQLHRPFPPSPWMSVLDSPFTAPHFHQSQQTTPRPAIHHRHTQTDINGIVHLPAFAGIMATPPPEQSASSNTTANIPSTTSPSFTAAANKQPHERWQYVNLIPTPTVTTPTHPELTQDFPSPIGGTPRNKRSKTPPRSTTPTRTRQPDPRSGSPVPTRTAPRPTPQQFLPTVQPLPKHPPPTLLPTHQAPAINQPLPSLQPQDGPSSRERQPNQHRPQHHPRPRPRRYTHGHPTILYNHHSRRQLHWLQNTPRHLQPPHRLPQSCIPCHKGITTRRGAPATPPPKL